MRPSDSRLRSSPACAASHPEPRAGPSGPDTYPDHAQHCPQTGCLPMRDRDRFPCLRCRERLLRGRPRSKSSR
ncbi:hypothetical protein EVA_08831 [gut metagenome]|uniref:Uncharacterized protein n=1 Tax=gut metagenome TaxID=749906 RepID=J9GLM4_9ZZZZ